MATPSLVEVMESLKKTELRLNQGIRQKLIQNKLRLRPLAENKYFKEPGLIIQNSAMSLALNTRRLECVAAILNSAQKRLDTGSVRLLNCAKTTEAKMSQRTAMLEEKLKEAMKQTARQHAKELTHSVAMLDAYSPLKILQRGYSLAYEDERLIHSVKEIQPDSVLQLRFTDGTAKARVEEIEEKQ